MEKPVSTKGKFVPRAVPNEGRRKQCTQCLEWWPISCFQRDAHNPDGHRNDCKACRQERRRELVEGASRCKPWRRKGLAKCW